MTHQQNQGSLGDEVKKIASALTNTHSKGGVGLLSAVIGAIALFFLIVLKSTMSTTTFICLVIVASALLVFGLWVLYQKEVGKQRSANQWRSGL